MEACVLCWSLPVPLEYVTICSLVIQKICIMAKLCYRLFEYLITGIRNKLLGHRIVTCYKSGGS